MADPRSPELIVVRGGGDLATGIIWRLTRAGWPVVVTELAEPLTVRRSVAVSSAVREGVVDIEGMRARSAGTVSEAIDVARAGEVGVVVSPDLPGAGADVVIDARIAKRNLDTTIDDAPLVIGVGPGFIAGVDCHAVVETKRGHHLGRVFWAGSAAADTGVPGEMGGHAAERVLRARSSGPVAWDVEIGDVVDSGQRLGRVGADPIDAPFRGVVRGLIASGVSVAAGLKIGDVDPRSETSVCREISDKALSVGGGVTEAVLTWMAGRG